MDRIVAPHLGHAVTFSTASVAPILLALSSRELEIPATGFSRAGASGSG